MARYRAWREPDWEFKAYANMPRSYRAWVAIVIAATTLTLVPVLLAADPTHTFGSPAYVALILLISVPLGMAIFRSDDSMTIDFIALVPYALIFAEQPWLAVAASIVSSIAGVIHKPIVAHLAYVNVVATAWVIAVSAFAFQELAGGRDPSTQLWVIACLASFSLSFVLDPPIFGATMLLGRYMSRPELVSVIVGNARTQLIALAPLAILVGAMLRYEHALYALFLLPPFLITYQVFSQKDELVDVRNEARTDPLTGLNNRRSLVLALDELLSDATDHGDRPSWVMLMDLDNFKRLNDSLGHDAGDDALVEAAQCLQHSVRADDYCGRYGGEEFVALVRKVSHHDAYDIAERVRAAIERRLGTYDVTASIGLHAITPKDDALSALYEADQAMYHAKTEGKNRIRHSSPETRIEDGGGHGFSVARRAA